MSNGPGSDPRWRPLAAARPAMSAAWWQWVASRDSLTARLVSAGGQQAFRVRLLDQRLGRPRRDEALVLGLPPGRHAWLREVALCLDERPWVVARSVVPLSGLHGQRLDRLGERSLGSWLFRQPDLYSWPRVLAYMFYRQISRDPFPDIFHSPYLFEKQNNYHLPGYKIPYY